MTLRPGDKLTKMRFHTDSFVPQRGLEGNNNARFSASIPGGGEMRPADCTPMPGAWGHSLESTTQYTHLPQLAPAAGCVPYTALPMEGRWAPVSRMDSSYHTVRVMNEGEAVPAIAFALRRVRRFDIPPGRRSMPCGCQSAVGPVERSDGCDGLAFG